ncbi:MAG TPA: flagellar hook protein FlgE [Micropepsaceae bacterium]|nr:flagellar hook protein FlgE [Micropepsaceae bacterium]
MSLYGALLTGVSGLDAQSRALSVTSSNISNVNTVGYKTSSANFSTFLASSGSSNDISPSSVQVTSSQQLTQQGLLQSTGNSTDLAISGNGFFVVTDNAANPQAMQYTRAGSFTPDSQGRLKNSSGFYLEGWTLNPDGSMPANRSSLGLINLGTLNGTAEATSSMSLRANLQASSPVVPGYTTGAMTAGTDTPQFPQTVNVYDSQGTARPMELSFVKTAADTWKYEIAYQGPVADIGGAGNNPVTSGTITFNADGTLSVPPTATMNIPWAASTGLAAQSVTITFGSSGSANGVTQYDSPSALTSANVDGAPYGALTSVSVDDQGYVSALFDNGIEKRVFKVPVATFTDPDALAAVAGNAYQITDGSGAATILEAKTGGAGSIASNSLEASTVDLAKEFSDLITTQRAYSAATRIITTADQMLQELMQIKQ